MWLCVTVLVCDCVCVQLYHCVLLHASRKLSQREHFELRSLREKFRTKSGNSSLARVGGEDHVVSLPVKGLYATGLYYDLPQVDSFAIIVTKA